MHIQQLLRGEDPSVLHLSWIHANFLRGILVQIATNVEFTETHRTFLLPLVSGCTLDTGSGNWYVRVGGLVGDPVHGSVEWSGTYGPWPVLSSKPVVPAPSPKFQILYTHPVAEGFRIHTDPVDRTLAFWEVSQQGSFPASNTKWYYDIAAGEFRVRHLDHTKLQFVRLHLLLIPVEVFHKPLNLVQANGLLGTEYTIHSLCSGRIAKGTPLKPLRISASSDKTHHRGDEALLQQATITPNMKFASHSDYLRYKTALERSR